MNDAEKVLREALDRWLPDRHSKRMVDAALDSILTELAEAKRRRPQSDLVRENTQAQYAALVAAEERAENAERERNETRERWSAEHVRANSAEARIQTLEAAIREHLTHHGSLGHEGLTTALAEDEA